jgi:hypothetical protein
MSAFVVFITVVTAEWIANDISPVLSNFSCPFAVIGWNCLNFLPEGSEARGQACAQLRYVPGIDEVADFQRYDPIRLFSIYNGATIYFDGDSLSTQHFADFSCRLQPYLLTSKIQRASSAQWCNQWNLCHPEHKQGPITGGEATFGFRKMVVRVILRLRSNFRQSLLQDMSSLTKGDVVVANAGMHHDIGFMTPEVTKLLPAISKATMRGVRVIWRETTASHFRDSPDRSGLWSNVFTDKQLKHEAFCADGDFFDATLAWEQSFGNAQLTKLLTDNNITVLRIWNATFSAPSMCHVGGGRDCVHFCFPGVMGYATDLLLFHLLHNK